MRIEILNLLKSGMGNNWEFTGHIIDDKQKIPICGSVPKDVKTDTRLKKVILRKANILMEKYEQDKKKPKEKTLEQDDIFVDRL